MDRDLNLLTHNGWKFRAKTEADAIALIKYIDYIESSDSPHAIPDSDNAGLITHSAFDGIIYLEVPERITYIGACAFAKNKDLQTIIIKGPAHLAQDCFNGSGIKSVTADNVVQLGAYCFWHCDNLEQLQLRNVFRAGDRAIAKCGKLKDVWLNGLFDFGCVIYKCQSLTFANIGGNLTKPKKNIDIAAVQLCPNLAQIIVSPGDKAIDSVVNIWRENMSPNISNIRAAKGNIIPVEPVIADAPEVQEEESQDLPKYVYRVNKNGWVARCTDPKTRDKLIALAESGGKLPAGDINAEISLFPDLISITLPDYITDIPDYAFAQCYELKNIVGRGVKTVGNHALYCTFSATKVDLPNADIASDDAFNGCGYNVPGMKINVPKLKNVGQFTFWMTGASKLDLPNVLVLPQNAIEENANLRILNAPNAKLEYMAVSNNPNLQTVFAKEKNKYAIYGSPKLNSRTNMNLVKRQKTMECA